MSKKKLLSLSLVAIMIATWSLSSLAWFNDSDSVKNEFHIASSGDASDPDNIFSVDLWENTPDGDKDQDGHSYDKILPGSELKKTVTVENTGAYDQYIRVVVSLNKGQAWFDVLGRGYDLSTIFKGHDESKWTRSVGTLSGDTITYVYYLNEILAPTDTAELFTDVVIPEHLTQEDMAKLGGAFELNIRADAIQTENLGEGVDTAAEAFAAANWGNYVNAEPQPKN